MFTYKDLLLSPAPVKKLNQLHATGELEEHFPELAALDINDKISRRHKNNFHHSLKVLQQAIDQEESIDIILRTAALLHDVGKPATRKLEANGEVTFQQHEHVGAKMAVKILKSHGYSKEEISAIRELIANHMRSFGASDREISDSAARRLAADVQNPLQLERLFKIFRADVTTRHDNRRARILAGVDKLEATVTKTLEADKLAARRPAITGNDLMEIFGLKPGRELGAIMKALNTEEGLKLTRDEAIAFAETMIV